MLKQLRGSTESGAALWEDHWRRFDDIRYDAAALRWDGILDLVDARLGEGRMLEAGCGLGRYLLYAEARGGNCIGIDFAPQPLARVKTHRRSARVVAADLTRLPFRGQTFDTILCLGVLEHFERGAHDALGSLTDALRPRGWLVVTVPYANLLKRRRAARGDGDVIDARRNVPDGRSFYQYCFTRSEARDLLVTAGLNVVIERPISRLFWLLGRRAAANRPAAASGAVAATTSAAAAPRGMLHTLLREAAYWGQWAIPGDLTSHMIAVVGQKRA